MRKARVLVITGLVQKIRPDITARLISRGVDFDIGRLHGGRLPGMEELKRVIEDADIVVLQHEDCSKFDIPKSELTVFQSLAVSKALELGKRFCIAYQRISDKKMNLYDCSKEFSSFGAVAGSSKDVYEYLKYCSRSNACSEVPREAAVMPEEEPIGSGIFSIREVDPVILLSI